MSYLRVTYRNGNQRGESESGRTRAQAEQKISALYREITEGKKNFAELMKEHSDSTEGAEVVWVSRKNGPGAIETVAWELDIGELSVPIEADGSFYIVLRVG
jgi:parvulin-like peptidyl-prolyl isomerase